jgi:hypothetical protein
MPLVGKVALVGAVLIFVVGCGGGGEEPQKQETKPATPASQPAPAEQAADEEYDDYEELDVWIEAEPDEGPPPLRVHFTSEVESDEENGGPYTYKWDFGDGSSSAEANPIYTYAKLG